MWAMMQDTLKRRALGTFAILTAAALTSPAAAQTAEEFYRGRQLRFIVSTASGGDYDQWSRLVARHWGRLLPGNPSFVVQNMPGAGGIVMANHMFNQAARDGSMIGMIGRNLALQAVMGDKNARFEPQRFNWLGSPEVTNYVCAVMAGSPAERADQLFDKEVLMAGAGAGTGTSTMPPLFSNLLGFKMKLVEGYGSSTAGSLAMERREVHGLCQSVTSLRSNRPGWIEDGRIKILFNTERQPIPGIDAPTIFQFAKSDEQRRILTLFASTSELGRPIVAPPEVPVDRVAALRKGFDALLSDPEFLADAARNKLVVTHVSGNDLAGLVRDMVSTPPEIVVRMQAMMK